MTKDEIIDLISNWENSEFIFAHFNSQTEDLSPLMSLVFDDSKKVYWRAAYIMDRINEKQPELIRPYLPQIIQAISSTTSESKLRHFLKVISLNPIARDHAGLLFDHCLAIFTTNSYAIAVRVHAMQILYEISKLEPELKKELILVIEQELEQQPTAGIRSRGTRILKSLHTETKATEKKK